MRFSGRVLADAVFYAESVNYRRCGLCFLDAQELEPHFCPRVGLKVAEVEPNLVAFPELVQSLLELGQDFGGEEQVLPLLGAAEGDTNFPVSVPILPCSVETRIS